MIAVQSAIVCESDAYCTCTASLCKQQSTRYANLPGYDGIVRMKEKPA